MQANERLLTQQRRSLGAEFCAREDDGPVIEGYFSVFDSDYPLWEGAVERVARGAFSETLDGDIRALINHDTRLVLGRTAAGTLELREDEKGLWGRIRINERDGDAMNLYARVQRGDISQCSFGFDILDEEHIELAKDRHMWIIRKVRLYEVSVVTFPAYAETSVSARKAEVAAIRQRELEAWKNQMKERISYGT